MKGSNEIKQDSPTGNKTTKMEVQYDKLIKRILSILDSFFISSEDFSSIKQLFDDVNLVGTNLLTAQIKNNEQFFTLWNNFIENVNNYFQISPEIRLEHYIKSMTSHVFSLVSQIQVNSEEVQSLVHQIKALLHTLANKYQQDIEYIQEKLYSLQAILVQSNSYQEFQQHKAEMNSSVSKMIQATEEFDEHESRMKKQIQQLLNFTADFELIFGKQKNQLQNKPEKPTPTKIKYQQNSSKSPSKIPPPNFLKNRTKAGSSPTQSEITNTPTTMEMQLQQEKVKDDEKIRKKLVKELDETLREEQRLNSVLDQIKEEIASVRQQYSAAQVSKSETNIITQRNNLRAKKQDLEVKIDGLKEQVNKLEKKREEALRRAKLDEEQQKFFALEASIQNEFLKNLVRYTSQYTAQIQQTNKDFGTIIKELKSYIAGGPEQQTVSFSNQSLKSQIEDQKRINEKLDSDINLLIQQQELFDENRLIDIQCSTKFEEINRMKEDIQNEKKRKEMIIKENKSLKTKRETEQERNEERSKRLENEIKKWNQRTEELKHYVVPELEDPVPIEDYISRSQFDPVQDLIDERGRIQVAYHELRKTNSPSNQVKLEAYKKKYSELTHKISQICHANVYDELQKREKELKVLRDAYGKSLEDSIKLRKNFVQMYTSTGELETEICIKLRELDRRNVPVNIDEDLTSLIASRLVEKLNDAAEIKTMFDWLNDHFDDPSVKNETKIQQKIQNAVDIISANLDSSLS